MKVLCPGCGNDNGLTESIRVPVRIGRLFHSVSELLIEEQGDIIVWCPRCTIEAPISEWRLS